MPQFGSGIIPAAGGIANELSAVVRRGFMPRMYVQIWKSAPLIAALLGAAQVASGGLSPITVPVQGTPMVSGQWTDYSGSFAQPATLPGISDAEFNLKAFISTLPFLGFEGLVQIDYSIVPLIEARINDTTNVTIDTFAQALYNNISNQQQLVGLPAAIDDGTNAVTYGGINRTTSQFWKSLFVNASQAPQRANVLPPIAQVTKVTGEMPTMGVMGFGTWTALALDFVGLERYNIGVPSAGASGGSGTPGADGKVQSLFRALDVAGVPIYADPYCPEGLLYLLNTNYLSLFLHEKAAFSFTGFESTIPNNQLGYVGAVLSLLELVNVKPRAHGRFSGYTPSFT
jgi:hypothetical protein